MTKNEQFTVWYGNLKIDEVIAYFNLPSERINYESIQEILLENFDCKEYFPALNNILFLGLLEIEKIDTNKYLKFIEALLKNGFNSNYCDVEGNNIIQAAMKSGCSTEFIVNLINLTLNGSLEYKDIINTLDDKNKKELLLMLETKKNKLEALKNHLMVSFELESLSFITLQGICYESNMAELSKIIERIENEKFLGQTAKSIELNREFSDVLTENALKLLGQGRFWREVSTGKNQSFSSQKVKIKKK